MDIDGDGTVLFPTTGNVGIGSTVTSPTYKLEVGGSARIYGSLVDSAGATGTPGQILQSVGTGISWFNNSGITGIAITANSTNQNHYLTITPNTTGSITGLGVTTSGLVFNPSAGNLGINTTSPTARLSVVTPSTGDSILQVADNVSSGSMFRINNTSGYPLMDVDGDGTVLFPTTGNVGIGTTVTAPTFKLEVGGNTSISGNLLFNSGYGLAATAYGCRAWVSFDTSGTRLGFGNVSSVTNDSTGTYTVNFTTSMPDINYSAISNSSSNTSSRVDTYNTGSLRVLTYDVSLTNPTRCSVAVFR